jgi:large subunit ribosomal protein L18
MKFLNSIKKKLRLSIFRSNKHIYAQITDDFNCKTLVSCSSLEKSFKKLFSNKNNSENAWIIGRTLAERSLNKKIQKVVFDKGLYKYHGRIKALAEGARAGNLKF